MQNAEVFCSRIGSLRKALRSRAEFVCIDAPYPSEPEGQQSVDDSDGTAGSLGRSWWRWTDLEPGTRPSRAAHYSGWDASQAAIQAALEAHAPIDGLLGFSQGATAAALYLAHTAAGGEQAQRRQHQLRFSVHIAGFLPRDASYAAALRQGRPTLPSLHVLGAADALVPEERTQALYDCWERGTVQTFTHPGAHMVPTCSGAFKALMVELLDDVRQGREGEWRQAAAAGGGGGKQQAAAAAAAGGKQQAAGSEQASAGA